MKRIEYIKYGRSKAPNVNDSSLSGLQDRMNYSKDLLDFTAGESQ